MADRATTAQDNLATITRICLDIANEISHGAALPDKTRLLQAAADACAQEGTPVDIVLHSAHVGMKAGITAKGATSSTSALDDPHVVVDILDRITSTISLAYTSELCAAAERPHAATDALTSAILSGCASNTAAREQGITVADDYFVLAIALPLDAQDHPPTPYAGVAAQRRLRRVRTELTRRCGRNVLSLLDIGGGTILVPLPTHTDDDIDALIKQLGDAAEISIAATVARAHTRLIPTAAKQVHELLNMVLRLGRTQGIHRFEDLALEYQLARPGPGRDALTALLDPLAGHPELIETLRCYFANNRSRQQTAKMLRIHTKSVDYRIRRIGQLTGIDTSTPSGLWSLYSALTARAFATTANADISEITRPAVPT
ncbi:PucR family transcriptional regulator [Nocardia callitridis]|uniref:PucR family transcriptional regulator n=1 Tax=Nocardia callitridis TaxID=648753 RepID=UPI0031F16D21